VRVVVVVVVVVVIDTMTTTTTTMRISTRPPLTAASRQDTRTTPRHTHTRQCVYVCVFFVCVRLPLVLGTLSYTYWPVIRTSEAYLLLEREPNVHQMCASTYAHTHIYIYVCVRVCACVRVCVRATRTKTMLYQRRAVLSYITTSHKMMMIERTARVCVYIYIYIYIYIYMCGAYYSNTRTACTHAIIVCVRSGAVDRCV